MILFADIEQFKKYCSVNTGFALSDYELDFQTAYEKQVLPYLSATQFAASKDSSNAKDVKLMDYVRTAVANLGVTLFYDILFVNITANGVKDSAPDGQKVSDRTYKGVYNSLLTKGHTAVEQMIAYLESEKAYFTAWATANQTIFNELFIRTAVEFDTVLAINESRRLFKDIQRYVRTIENQFILPALGQTLYTTLHNHLKTNTLTVKESILLNNYLRPAQASLALAKAPFSATDYRDRLTGVAVLDENFSKKQFQDFFKYLTPGIVYHRSTLQQDGDEFLGLMKQYLLANAADFGITLPDDDDLALVPIRNETDWNTNYF